MGEVAKNNRTATFTVIVGTNGTGKTTFLKEIVLNELKKKNSRVLILTPDFAEWQKVPEVHPDFPERIQRYTGARRIVVAGSQVENVLQIVRENYTRGLLIFDDCRSYFKASTLPVLEELFIRRRQMMVDICAVGHGFNKIPPAFFAYMSHIVMFKTTSPVTVRKDEFDDIAKWEAIQQRINKEAAIRPHYYEIHKI